MAPYCSAMTGRRTERTRPLKAGSWFDDGSKSERRDRPELESFSEA